MVCCWCWQWMSLCCHHDHVNSLSEFVQHQTKPTFLLCGLLIGCVGRSVTGLSVVLWYVQVDQLFVLRQLACYRHLHCCFALLSLETPQCSATNQSTRSSDLRCVSMWHCGRSNRDGTFLLVCLREQLQSIVMSTSVCVSVCQSTRISPEPHATRSLPIL